MGSPGPPEDPAQKPMPACAAGSGCCRSDTLSARRCRLAELSESPPSKLTALLLAGGDAKSGCDPLRTPFSSEGTDPEGAKSPLPRLEPRLPAAPGGRDASDPPRAEEGGRGTPDGGLTSGGLDENEGEPKVAAAVFACRGAHAVISK